MQRNERLKVSIDQINQESKGAIELELADEEMGIRVQPKDANQQQVPILPPAPPAKRRLGYIQRLGGIAKKDIKDYVPSGSFVRAVLLSGVVVGTGTQGADSPEPIVLRLVDHGIFSKGYQTQQIKEAIIIGSCSGHISSERAKCRLESLSLVNRHGNIIEKQSVEGWVMGEDGRAGIKGLVVDKSTDVARMAVLSGMLSGMSQFFQNQATKGIFPISPITGPQNALAAKDALKAGSLAGGGNALEKLADYAIKRAEQMSPVIVVGSGRVVDVVFKKGFGLKLDDNSKVVKVINPAASTASIDNGHDNDNFNQDEYRASNMQKKFLEAEELADHQGLSAAKARGM